MAHKIQDSGIPEFIRAMDMPLNSFARDESCNTVYRGLAGWATRLADGQTVDPKTKVRFFKPGETITITIE